MGLGSPSVLTWDSIFSEGSFPRAVNKRRIIWLMTITCMASSALSLVALGALRALVYWLVIEPGAGLCVGRNQAARESVSSSAVCQHRRAGIGQPGGFLAHFSHYATYRVVRREGPCCPVPLRLLSPGRGCPLSSAEFPLVGFLLRWTSRVRRPIL